MRYADRTQPRLQALVYDILPSTTAVFSYAIGSRKLSANEKFFVGAQTVVRLLQTTQMAAQIKSQSFESVTELFSFFFFTRGGCASCLRACVGARLLPHSYQFPNLSEGADCVGAQSNFRYQKSTEKVPIRYN